MPQHLDLGVSWVCVTILLMRAAVILSTCVLFSVVPTGGDSDFHYLEIEGIFGNSYSDLHYLEAEGIDLFGNSYLLTKVSSPYTTSSKVKFLFNQQFLLSWQQLPLPLIELSEFEYSRIFNFLGPISLFNGSSIMCNFDIIITYKNSPMSHDSSNNNNSHSFMSVVTSESTTVYSFNMNVRQYMSVTAVQAKNTSLLQYCNTTGLCNVCSTLICSQKATTYFLIKPTYQIHVNNFFTSPQLHGSLLSGFIAVVLMESFCCSYFSCIISLFCYAYKKLKKKRKNSNYYAYFNNEQLPSHPPRRPTLIREQSGDEKLLPQLSFSTNNQHLDNSSTLSNCEVNTCYQALSVKEKNGLVDLHVQASSLPSFEIDCTSSQPQFDMESLSRKHSMTNRITNDQRCNAATEKLLIKIRNAFGELHKLSLDSRGLVYHSSQYGVSLIIPERAVQESASVWFGACLFSDKFKFGDYVPVTPIVWVHIDRKLDKSAELYIPHDVAISSEVNLQQFTVLTAHDDDCSNIITFQERYETQVQVSPGLFKMLSPHFCSNCVAVQKLKYKSIPRRYLIAQADKKNGRELLVQFIFLYQQKGCKMVVEDQCAKEGFKMSSYEPVTFTGDAQVSLSFEPHSVPGWKREKIGYSRDYISIEDIDYYQVMGCENASEVTEDELERLKLLEMLLSYPPRFRIRFKSDAVVERSQQVIVHFNQVHPPVKNTILLEGSIELHLSSTSSATSTGSAIDLMMHVNDSLLGDCLRIITRERDLREKWFDFGYRLGLTLGQLHDIELTSIDSIQRTKKVILQWRDQNRSVSWEPLAAALAKIGLNDLAHRVKNHFDSPVLEAEHDHHYKGVYCKLCDDYHLKPEDIQQEIPNSKSPPNMVDLINLVAAKIQDKFYHFGTALHLNDGFLKSLYDTYHNPIDRFIAVFNRWKDNDPDTYTWGTVIKVLQSDAIGAHAVAQDVIKHLTTKLEAAEHASSVNDHFFDSPKNKKNEDYHFETQRIHQEAPSKEPLTTRTIHQNVAIMDLLIIKIKNTFGGLHKLSLDRSGLVYHCSQYGVTLIIPEGAVQESATVWFGACLFSDKFQFGDYVPVTPIVWAHIDQKLMKPVELYLPHHIDTNATKRSQLFYLTASDELFITAENFLFTISDSEKIEIEPEQFRSFCYHFCSHCVAIKKTDFEKIKKRYKLAIAQKQEKTQTIIDFCIFYHYCMKALEEQYGFDLKHCTDFEFDGDVSVVFEPDSIMYWKRTDNGFCVPKIMESDVDFYKIMDCKPGDKISPEDIERLKEEEKYFNYPPRFRFKFTCGDETAVPSITHVNVTFTGSKGPKKCTIELLKPKNESEAEVPLQNQITCQNTAQPAASHHSHDKSASEQFKSVSYQLHIFISSCLIKVSMKLNARGLISPSLNDDMIDDHKSPLVKAAKLVSELQKTLNVHPNPKAYLNEVCTALKDIGEQQITDAVNRMGSNLTDTEDEDGL